MAITITSPTAYQVFKRYSGVGNIVVSGTYTGSPTAIEASWNGNPYQTIVPLPIAGVYTGTLVNQPQGQGTLTVRFTDDPATNATVAFVGIGDVFLVAGQSNAVGNGTNNQVYSHATLKAAMFQVGGTSWLEMADPTGYFGHGSTWPLVATLHMASQGVPFAVIATAVNGTCLSTSPHEWRQGGTAYDQALATLIASGVDGITAMLWFQGETDATHGSSQSAYQTDLMLMLDNLQADSALLTGVKMIVGTIGNHYTAAANRLDAVRAAQMYCWDNDSDILPGPSTLDIDFSDGDGAHFGTGVDGDTELATLANRWWRMISYNLFGGSQGRGPRFYSAFRAGVTVTVRFTGGVAPYSGRTDTTGWAFTDNGTPITVTAAAANGSSNVVLTLATEPVGIGLVTWGTGQTAAGALLKDAGSYPMPPEPFILESTTGTVPLDNTSTILDPTFAFYVDIENSSGVKQGSGPLRSVTKWQYTSRFDRAGTIAADFAANDPQVEHLTNRRILRAWALLNGIWTEVGAGRIDKIDTAPGQDGRVTLNVSGDDLITELRDRTVGNLKVGTGSGVSHESALATISTFAPDGWIFTPAAAADNDYFYARFGGESVLGALVDLADKTQTHFYRAPGRELIFASDFEASGIRAIKAGADLTPQTCAITSLRQTVDTHDLLTRIYPYGSGQGATRLTLAATNRSAPVGYTLNAAANYIENTAATALYGLVDFPQFEFKDIGPLSNTDADLQAAANMLFDAALQELQRRSTLATQRTYTLTIAGCYQLLRPLQTIQVTYRDPAQNINIDEELFILEATWELTANGLRTSRLVVSTDDRWPDSDESAAAERAVQGKYFTAHPQINGTAYWKTSTLYIGSDQTTQVAEMPLTFGEEVVQIQKVELRYKVTEPLSFISIVAGSAEADVVVDATSIEVDVTGTIDISHEHELPDHQHTINIGNEAVPDRNLGMDIFVGFSVLTYDGADVDVVQVFTNDYVGSTTSEEGGDVALALSGTGVGTGTGTATIDLSDAIGVSYGVYRADPTRTYGLDELEYRVNDGSIIDWTALDTGTLTALDYYKVDITEAVYDTTTFRPLQENNAVYIRRTAAASALAIDSSQGDGTTVGISTVPVDHGLVIGEPVTVTGTTHHNGNWTVVEITSPQIFRVNQSGDFNTDSGGSLAINRAAMVLAELCVRYTIQSTSYL